MGRETRILFSLDALSSGLEAHCREKSVQIGSDMLIEAVKLTTFVLGELRLPGKRRPAVRGA
jgi:hypothetical protein